MKKILLFLLLILPFISKAQDKKLSALTQVTWLTNSDLVYVVSNIVTRQSYSISISNLLDTMKSFNNWPISGSGETNFDSINVTNYIGGTNTYLFRTQTNVPQGIVTYEWATNIIGSFMGITNKYQLGNIWLTNISGTGALTNVGGTSGNIQFVEGSILAGTNRFNYDRTNEVLELKVGSGIIGIRLIDTSTSRSINFMPSGAGVFATNANWALGAAASIGGTLNSWVIDKNSGAFYPNSPTQDIGSFSVFAIRSNIVNAIDATNVVTKASSYYPYLTASRFAMLDAGNLLTNSQFTTNYIVYTNDNWLLVRGSNGVAIRIDTPFMLAVTTNSSGSVMTFGIGFTNELGTNWAKYSTNVIIETINANSIRTNGNQFLGQPLSIKDSALLTNIIEYGITTLTNPPGSGSPTLRFAKTNGIGYTEFSLLDDLRATNRIILSIGSNTVASTQVLKVHSTSISGGINTITLTNDTDATGGGGSLQTNANQFGPQVTLTLKDGAYLTNPVVFGITGHTNPPGSSSPSTRLWQTNGLSYTEFTVPSQWLPTNSIVLSVTNPAAGQVLKISSVSISGGIASILLTNDSDLQGGTGNLATNANQFGAQVTLTIKDGAYFTNLSGFGTNNLETIAITNAFRTIPELFNGSNGTTALALTNQLDFLKSGFKALTNDVGTNLVYMLTNISPGVHLEQVFRGLSGTTNTISYLAVSGGTNINWLNWSTNGSNDIIIKGGYTYHIDLFSDRQTNITAKVWNNDPYIPFRGLLAQAGASISNAWVGGRVFTYVAASGAGYTNCCAAGNITNAAQATIAAHTLTNNGDQISVRSTGRYSTTGQSKGIQLIYGSQTILDTGLMAVSNGTWIAEARIYRVGNTEQYYEAWAFWDRAVAGGKTNVSGRLAQTNGINTTLKTTLQANVVSAITNEMMSVDYVPVPR